MKTKPKPAPKTAHGKWQKTQYANLIRNVSSGTFYARFRVQGKLVWKSLKTDRISVAQLRLADKEKEERTKAAKGQLLAKGKVLFEQVINAYREKGFRPVTPRNRKDVKPLKPAAIAYYEQRVAALVKSWPALLSMEMRTLTERDCVAWADRVRRTMSSSVFNHTLGILRNLIDFGIKIGARYDNPATAIMRESESSKTLELPDSHQFDRFVTAIETGGSGWSQACADLVRFLAFGGFRIGEARHVTWANVDLARGQITVRGHPETGLKNRRPGEVRIVPIIPEMRTLLERLRSNALTASPESPVMSVRECQRAMNRAAAAVGMKRITHHDLRHLFATRCIESQVDIPTVARWLGHRDGGALAMRVYGHLRDSHSSAMAQKVRFAPTNND